MTTEQMLARDAKIVGITPESLAARREAYRTAQPLATGVFRKRGVRGNEGLVYPDSTVRAGYQIIRADAPVPEIGSKVRYGTGGENHGMVGTVTKIGEIYAMSEDRVVIDEDYGNHAGERKVGEVEVMVRRIYFSRK